MIDLKKGLSDLYFDQKNARPFKNERFDLQKGPLSRKNAADLNQKSHKNLYFYTNIITNSPQDQGFNFSLTFQKFTKNSHIKQSTIYTLNQYHILLISPHQNTPHHTITTTPY